MSSSIAKSARFLSLVGYLVMTLLVPPNQMRNIRATLPATASADEFALVCGRCRADQSTYHSPRPPN
jgi:hypothetical protein